MDDEQIEVKSFEIDVKGSAGTGRLDAYLSGRFGDYSRTFIKRLIESGGITVNGKPVKASYTPQSGDHVVARVPMLAVEPIEAEDIALDIIYEDEWLIVLNKPADMVVHPAKGHQHGTLVNAVAWHCKQLSTFAGELRPGVVHRLDRDTSGVILMVKQDSVHENIGRQFEHRTVQKEYLAICKGTVELDNDVIDAPIGKHARRVEKMAVRYDIGRQAQTAYEVIERLTGFTIVRCLPHSGRTHQIRIHLAHIGHPVACDLLYGRRDAIYPSDLSGGEHRPSEEPLLGRQALHARRLTIHHPALEREMSFEAEVPADMMRLVQALRDRDAAGG